MENIFRFPFTAMWVYIIYNNSIFLIFVLNVRDTAWKIKWLPNSKHVAQNVLITFIYNKENGANVWHIYDLFNEHKNGK